MDDLLYYLLIGIGYVLYNWLTRKRMPMPDRQSTPEDAGNTAPKRQVTFEELLREITEAKEGKSPAGPTEVDVVDYDDVFTDQIETLEELTPSVESVQFNEEYEKAKNMAFNRLSLEETAKLEDTQVSFNRFSVFEHTSSRNLLEEYTADLRDSEGLKKAVVLSEILNRKHF
ncbi:MAG: hypothetical protein KatS3mg032_0056 [Cyclobacteriaceae bacterium]|nr:MAG: hypothetical protein KatS3mg032_0056 [Cyclobacteriaceae bacterium]